MIYNKPYLSFEQLADRLLDKGLRADRDKLIGRLKSVNYYRLKSYFYITRQQILDDDSTIFNVDFDFIWCHYLFDRQIRILILDAIERVEVALRSQIANYLTKDQSPFAYINYSKNPHYLDILSEIRTETLKSKETFVTHFKNNYSDCHICVDSMNQPIIDSYTKKALFDLPLWLVVEVMSFGKLSYFYKYLTRFDQKKISDFYKVDPSVLENWIHSLVDVRNIAAHHGRLWNREFKSLPLKIPYRNPDWHYPYETPETLLFGHLTVLRYLLKLVAPTTKWKKRLEKLIEEYTMINLKIMGFPENWMESKIWKE